jgi:hypothetical protein
MVHLIHILLYESSVGSVCKQPKVIDSMANLQEDEAVTFQSPKWIGLVCAVFIGIGFLAIGLLHPAQEKVQVALIQVPAICLGTVFLTIPVTVFFDSAQGRFSLDREAIKQVPWFRKPRYLRWENVQRVQWGPRGCCLEGTDITISMRFGPLSRQAKTLIERVLSPHFDLTIKPVRQWSFEPNLRSFLHWLSKVIGISIAGAAVFILPFAVLVLLNANRWVGAAWLFVFLMGMIGFLSRGAKELRQKEEQINPTWRSRQTEELSSSHS